MDCVISARRQKQIFVNIASMRSGVFVLADVVLHRTLGYLFVYVSLTAGATRRPMTSFLSGIERHLVAPGESSDVSKLVT